MRAGAALALALIAGVASAQDKTETVATTFEWRPSTYEGSQFRDAVAAARRALDKDRDVAKAQSLLRPAIEFCDGAQSTAERAVVAVASDAEADEFRGTLPAGTTLRVVDVACPNAYSLAAYIAFARRDGPAAERLFDRAIALGPYLVDARSERAFVVGGLGDHARSLALYREALAFAESRRTEPKMRAVLLRGMGFQLIELGDLDNARKAYDDSLVLDPGNAIALHELEYIAGMMSAEEAARP